MKPFRFPLQPLRTLREHQEEAARERYSGAMRAVQEAEDRLQVARLAVQGAYANVATQLAAGVAGEELQQARAWCTVLETKVKEGARALEQARQAVEARRQELQVASRERETLERFYEKRRGAYDRQAGQEEQKALDEMAIQLVHSTLPLRPA